VLSHDQVERFIAARYGARASRPTPLGAGQWSRAYGFTLDDRDAVARFGAHVSDFAKDQRMGAVSSPRLPIPRVLEVGEAPEGYFAISERVCGVLLDELDAASMRTVLPGLLRALDALAEVDVSARSGYGGWGPDGAAGQKTWREAVLAFAGDRLVGWRAALEGSPTGAGPLDTGFAKLQELAADLPDVKQVIHGDLLYHNVLVEGAEVRGLLDWGNSMYGDAIYDAAWLIFWWPWYPNWTTIDIRAELDRHWASSGSAPVSLDHRLLCYQLRIGLDTMAYYAFIGNWQDLDRCARQTLELAVG